MYTVFWPWHMCYQHCCTWYNCQLRAIKIGDLPSPMIAPVVCQFRLWRTWGWLWQISPMSCNMLSGIKFLGWAVKKCIQKFNHNGWLVVWNMNGWFFHLLGISSSQLTKSYFSEGQFETTSQMPLQFPLDPIKPPFKYPIKPLLNASQNHHRKQSIFPWTTPWIPFNRGSRLRLSSKRSSSTR